MKSDAWAALSGLKFIGTSTSDFQSNPWRSSPPASDWEYELKRNLNGKSSGIKLKQERGELPNLLAQKVRYVERSAELGLNMFRFSIDLARLNPEEGVFDTKLMTEYVRLMASLRVSGQEPLMTLHHFTMPVRLVRYKAGRQELGAWQHPDVLKYFCFSISKVVEFLSDADALRSALVGFDASTVDRLIAEGLVKYFMPFNEPAVTLGNSYLAGVFPPYKKNRLDLVLGTIRAMAKVYAVMEESIRELGRWVPADRAPLIGNGYNWQYFDGLGSSLAHAVVNEWYTRYLEKVVPRSDWMGLHYYCRTASLPGAKDQANKEYGDHPVFGDIYPQGIFDLLEKMHAAYPSKEILVSEIGFSDREDRRRPHWILETVRYILEAKRRGVPVVGILYWSLVDNFEWELGMSQKFGLFSEGDLEKPLLPLMNSVRSWQVWRGIARCMFRSSESAWRRLSVLEAESTWQHREASQCNLNRF